MRKMLAFAVAVVVALPLLIASCATPEKPTRTELHQGWRFIFYPYYGPQWNKVHVWIRKSNDATDRKTYLVVDQEPIFIDRRGITGNLDITFTLHGPPNYSFAPTSGVEFVPDPTGAKGVKDILTVCTALTDPHHPDNIDTYTCPYDGRKPSGYYFYRVTVIDSNDPNHPITTDPGAVNN